MTINRRRFLTLAGSGFVLAAATGCNPSELFGGDGDNDTNGDDQDRSRKDAKGDGSDGQSSDGDDGQSTDGQNQGSDPFGGDDSGDTVPSGDGNGDFRQEKASGAQAATGRFQYTVPKTWTPVQKSRLDSRDVAGYDINNGRHGYLRITDVVKLRGGPYTQASNWEKDIKNASDLEFVESRAVKQWDISTGQKAFTKLIAVKIKKTGAKAVSILMMIEVEEHKAYHVMRGMVTPSYAQSAEFKSFVNSIRLS
ncbi:hypothetical protein M3A96_00200 [Helcobacillus massiliensis]|uniref:hypothetical protein n=1 Tax=Helcobacillus massiliensis TaxID=521392 RepID=UPI0021A42455|nr:hypothetical protein [Helcobacillus massiliensis]MCT1556550.1 hypothetical protein [Helcobacillus massiliensis]MCT2035744.1 hypothetical protein [Helcobacillus massiliensis]MCT2331174.1 hypothetical protein [Helcobacillus massiliensis]